MGPSCLSKKVVLLVTECAAGREHQSSGGV